MIEQMKQTSRPARVTVETLLPCSADRAWNAVQTTDLFAKVAAPVASIRAMPGESLPERWSMDRAVHCRTYLFGFIPMGMRKLEFESIDPQTREIQTRESDGLVSRWDHHIRIRPADETSCWYSDDVEIEAGWLTPLVRLFAQAFYQHRHRRWMSVAKALAAGA